MTALAVAYVSCGLWVADCPRVDCHCAEHYGPHPVSGHVGGLTEAVFSCSECGALTGVTWPDERARIQAQLAVRPIPSTRNWLPGETAADLAAENIHYGIVSMADIVRGAL